METSALHSRAAARHRQASSPPPQDHLINAARHHGYVTISHQSTCREGYRLLSGNLNKAN